MGIPFWSIHIAKKRVSIKLNTNFKLGGLSMKPNSLIKPLTISTMLLFLVGAPVAFAQEDPGEEDPIQAMPRVKTVPSVQATPIEIPGKGQPVMKKKPSVQATPIEIPGKK
jgi:hypothetical protein